MTRSESRFERKWNLDNLDINNSKKIIYNSKFNFVEVFKKREVNSIYFDSISLKSIYENLDGHKFKKKYRLRWYGKTNYILDPKFEVKSKIGFVTFKKTYNLKGIDNLPLCLDSLSKLKKIVNDLKISKTELFPILCTHYDRLYYLSSNRLVRGTLDYNIQSTDLFKRYNYKFKKNFNRKIFELKYDTSLDSYVRNNIPSLFSRLTKSSKYIFSAIEKSNNYSF